MIFYCSTPKELTQNLLAMVSRGYGLGFNYFPKSISEAESILEKWDSRYGLSLDKQQQYRKYLSGESTFHCIVYSTGVSRKADEEFHLFNDMYAFLRDHKNHEKSPYKIGKFCFVLLARINETQLFDKDGEAITDKYKHLPHLNNLIAKQVGSKEAFAKPNLSIGSYTFIELTKRAKSIAELKERGLKENTKHATNFTWRLSQEKYNQIKEVGKNYVNNYQNNTNKPVNQYFEKYLKALEGFLGYRGVRVQVGKLYAEFCAYFKAKMGNSFIASGGRKLNLSYVKASSSVIPNNYPIHQYFKDLKMDAIYQARTELKEWKMGVGQKFLMNRFPFENGVRQNNDEYNQLEIKYADYIKDMERMERKKALAKQAKDEG